MTTNRESIAVSPTCLRILRLLVGRPPKTPQELATDLNISRSAISLPLEELVHLGFVDQQLVHSGGRGRPTYRFFVTLNAISRVFDGLQKFLVPATWKSIKKHLDDTTLQKICNDVAADVAAPFVQQITAIKPVERLKQLEEAQKRAGRVVEMKLQDGNAYYWKYTCPYALMVDDDRTVCEIDRRALEIGANAPIVQIQHRLDGNPCCVFQLQEHTTTVGDSDYLNTIVQELAG